MTLFFLTSKILFLKLFPNTFLHLLESHQYLFCKVALGRSYVIDDSEDGERRLPSGYDSIYLHSSTDVNSGTYRHRYMVPDSSQVLPLYLVQFNFDPNVVENKVIGGIDLADIKARIAETLSVLGPAAAAATEKMLTDIGSSYDAALTASKASDPLFEDRKNSVNSALASIDIKLAEIQANSRSIEEDLYAKLQAAMFQLQEETQRKMNALLSEELELRRQLGQIEWAEGFTTTLQETLPPMTFVSAWERQMALKESLYSSLGGKVSTRALDEIKADIVLNGSLDVSTKAAKLAQQTASSSARQGSITSPTTKTSAEPAVASSEIWASVLRGANGVTSTSTQETNSALAPAPAPVNPPAVRTSATTTTGPMTSTGIKTSATGTIGTTTPMSRAVSTPYSSSAASQQPPLEQRLARYSLRKEAERKWRQRKLEVDPSVAFANSGILTPEQAAVLYSCLPFGHQDDSYNLVGASAALGNTPPVTRCLYASQMVDPQQHGEVHAQAILSSYMQSGASDASVVLIRANGQVFGGYASDAWDLSSTFGGTPRSFLFSITRDCKVPYTGRVKGPRQASDDDLKRRQEIQNLESAKIVESMLAEARRLTGKDPEYDEAGRLLLPHDQGGQIFTVPVPLPRPRPFVRHDCLRSDPEGVIQFGVGDLILSGALNECKSELEQSYGIGLSRDEAKTLLAGAPIFKVDMIELWAVTSSAPAPSTATVDMNSDISAGAFGIDNNSFSTPVPGGRLGHSY